MSKEGINFFPFDTDFFQDKKVRLIKGEFGSKGVMILIRTLCAIYSDKGYYMEWEEDDCYLWSEDLGCDCSPNLIGEVINRCVKRGLFNEKVFHAFGVLTSHGIQIRYINAASRRNEIRIIKEYALFDKSELNESTSVKVTLFSRNVDISSQNVNISSQNADISPIKKEKKEREKDNTVREPVPVFNSEKAWEETFELYPKKSGAVMAHTAWMNKLMPVQEENRKDVALLIAHATEMYIADYTKQYPDDAKYRYVPKYEKWLKEDCDHWIREYEKLQRMVTNND